MANLNMSKLASLDVVFHVAMRTLNGNTHTADVEENETADLYRQPTSCESDSQNMDVQEIISEQLHSSVKTKMIKQTY